VLVMIVLFQRQFFQMLRWAMLGLAKLFLTNYM
jgi:hypothetical protein